jgi:hypothetical protein
MRRRALTSTVEDPAFSAAATMAFESSTNTLDICLLLVDFTSVYLHLWLIASPKRPVLTWKKD